MTPKRLICFGSLPLRSSQIMKVFEGPKCHCKFLLWALQNVAEYKVDSRKDNTRLNFFTFNGSSREFPILLRGLAQMTGRDTHFFGDLNRLKCFWHENIKFFDLAAFFDTTTLKKMVGEWCRVNGFNKVGANKKVARDKGAADDPYTEKVKMIFGLANRFISQLEQIDFSQERKSVPKYNFNYYQ